MLQLKPIDKVFRKKIYNAGLISINLFVSRFSGFLRNLLIARFLSPEIASLGFLSISFGQGIRTFFEIGTRQFIITSEKVDDNLIGSAWCVEFFKGLLLTSMLVTLALLGISDQFNIPAEVMLLSATIPICIGLLSPYTFLWERDQNFEKIVLQTSSGTIIGLASTAIMLILGTGWKSLPLGMASGLLTQAIWSHFAARKTPPLVPRLKHIKQIVFKGLPYTVIAFTTYANTLGVDVVIAASGALNWVGPYRMSMALAQVVIGSIPGVFAHISLSSEAERNRGNKELKGVSTDFYSIGLVIIAIAVFTPISFFVLPDVSVLLFGIAWKSTAILVPILTLLVALRSISAQLAVVTLAIGKPRIEAIIKAFEAFSSLIIVALLARKNIVYALYGMVFLSTIALFLRMYTLQFLKVNESILIIRLIYTFIFSVLTAILVGNLISFPASLPGMTTVLMQGIGSACISTLTVFIAFRLLLKKQLSL